MTLERAVEQCAAEFGNSATPESLAERRETCPVAYIAQRGGYWRATRYDDVAEVARDPKRFSAKVTGLGAVNLLPELGDDVHAVLFEQDPPIHTAWRRAMQVFFTVDATSRFEPFIRATARGLLADLRPRGAADLVDDLAARVPPLVVAALLGVPEPRHAEMADLTRAYFAEGGSDEQAVAFAGFMREQIRARRGRAGDDPLTWVVNAEVEGKRLTEREALKHALVMVAAGYLTTRDALGNLLLLLARDHGLRSMVRGEPAVAPDLVEESLRHGSPVAATGRTVRVPTTLAGVNLLPGDRVVLSWESGNHDDQRFERPDEVRVTRPHVRGHLAWGAGAHRCIGMHLARLELRVVLEEVLRAIPDFRLAPGVTPEVTGDVTRGPRTLLVEWNP